MNSTINNATANDIALFFGLPLVNITNASEIAEDNLFSLYEAYEKTEREWLTIYKIMGYIVGTLIIISNLTVVVSSGLILHKGQQPKSTYILLGNVSLADTIVGVSILFGMIVDRPSTSSPLCVIQTGMIVCPAMVSIFSVGLIAVDRYIYILHGLYYQRWFNTTRVRIGIVCIWMIGLTLGFIPATGWVNYKLRLQKCRYFSLFPPSMVIFNSTISIFPIILVTIIYSKILVKALKNVREIKASKKTIGKSDSRSASIETSELRINRASTISRETITTISIGLEPPKYLSCEIKRCSSLTLCNENCKDKNRKMTAKSKSTDDLNKQNKHESSDDCRNVDTISQYRKTQFDSDLNVRSLESNISTANIASNSNSPNKGGGLSRCLTKIKQRPREPNKWRAITIVMLTSGSFVITWLPYFIFAIIYMICEENFTLLQCSNIKRVAGGPLVTLAFLNSILNPLIYAWWHKGFKKSVKSHFRNFTARCFNKL